jgi:hypothetical protein
VPAPLLPLGGGQGKKLAQAAAAWAKDLLHHEPPPPETDDRPHRAINLAALGLLTRRPDEGAGVVYLWPSNVAAWSAFMGVQTQWRIGMAGATGLDYAGVRADLLTRMDEAQLREVWSGIQACERAVLGVWTEERLRTEQERRQPG